MMQHATPALHMMQHAIPALHMMQHATPALHMMQQATPELHMLQHATPALHMMQQATPEEGSTASSAYLGDKLCWRGVFLTNEVFCAAYEVVEHILLVVYAAGISPRDPELPAPPGTADSQS